MRGMLWGDKRWPVRRQTHRGSATGCLNEYKHTHTHTHTLTHRHTHTHTHTHTVTHTHTHTHTHTLPRRHTNTHTHTHARAHNLLLPSLHSILIVCRVCDVTSSLTTHMHVDRIWEGWEGVGPLTCCSN